MKKNKIPSIEQFVIDNYYHRFLEYERIEYIAKEFAKLHVKKQLDAILKNVKMKVNPELNGIEKNLAEYKGGHNNEYQIDIESITNAYNLENIK